MTDNDHALAWMFAFSLAVGFVFMAATGNAGYFFAGVIGAWGVTLVTLGLLGAIIPNRWQRRQKP